MQGRLGIQEEGNLDIGECGFWSLAQNFISTILLFTYNFSLNQPTLTEINILYSATINGKKYFLLKKGEQNGEYPEYQGEIAL